MGAAPRARAHARRHSGLHTSVHTHSRMQKHTQANVYASTRSEPTDRHASRWTPRRTSTQARTRTLHITHRHAGGRTPHPREWVGGACLLLDRVRRVHCVEGAWRSLPEYIHSAVLCRAAMPGALAPRPSSLGSRGRASARPAPTRDTHPPQRVSLNFLQSVVLAFLPHSGVFPRG